MHSLYKNDTKTRAFSCSMGMFEVRGPQFGELDAATMDCVVGEARQLVYRHGSISYPK